MGVNSFIFFILRKVNNSNKYPILAIHTIIDYTLHVMRIPLLESTEADSSVLTSERETAIISKGLFFFLLDYYFLNRFSHQLWFFNDKPTKLLHTKLTQASQKNFYFFWNKVETTFSASSLVWYGLQSLWKHTKLWILPITLCFVFIYYSFVIRSLPFSKIIFSYIILGNMIYLLISGFVLFVKKYQYRLYTSVIQRFWRRTLVIFWVIEASLFAVFVYLIFNASQEPMYVYDTVQIYKTHFYSWRFFLNKIILSTFLIIFTYMLLLANKWNSFTKVNTIIFSITVLLLYLAWLEFYQMFHLLNSCGSTNWVYDFTEHWWNLELEFKRTRIVNHYVTIGLIAKFWHIVFAIIFWIFFVLRGLESSRIRYPLLVANLQNFLIIYLMSWLYMYPWFKFVFRKPMDMPYFWFFVNNRRFSAFLFFNDMKLYYYGILELINDLFRYFWKNVYRRLPLYYLTDSSYSVGYSQFRKHNTRDLILNKLNKTTLK